MGEKDSKMGCSSSSCANAGNSGRSCPSSGGRLDSFPQSGISTANSPIGVGQHVPVSPG
jgi:hypothetical protein